MEINIFVSVSTVSPARWKEAFPGAIVLSQIPLDLPAGSIVWLHEMLPVDTFSDGVRFVVMYDEPTEEKGLKALSAGASGYCNSHAAPELFHTIEMAIRTNDGLWVGEALLSRLLTGINVRTPAANRNYENHPVLQELSERERLIALQVASGASNKEIANNTGIPERTIKGHLTHIFKKTGARDRLQLAILLNGPRKEETS